MLYLPAVLIGNEPSRGSLQRNYTTNGAHCKFGTPRPAHRANTTYLATTWPNGDVSLLGLRSVCPRTGISRFAGSNSRRLRAFVENPDLGHLFEASPLAASSLSPFCPCTPTFDSRSPAVGQHSLPITWGVGVGELHSPHLLGHTVIQGSSD